MKFNECTVSISSSKLKPAFENSADPDQLALMKLSDHYQQFLIHRKNPYINSKITPLD